MNRLRHQSYKHKNTDKKILNIYAKMQNSKG